MKMIKFKEFVNANKRVGIAFRNYEEYLICVSLLKLKNDRVKILDIITFYQQTQTFNKPCLTNAGYVTDSSFLVKYQSAPVFEFNDVDFYGLSLRETSTLALLARSSFYGVWCCKEDIIFNYYIDNHADGYVINNAAHDICSMIWSDIEEINLNPDIDKIIISNRKNSFKIAANEKEAATYIKVFHDKAMKALVRFYNLKRKMKKDGQVVIDLDDINCVTNITDAFLEDCKNE